MCYLDLKSSLDENEVGASSVDSEESVNVCRDALSTIAHDDACDITSLLAWQG